MSFQKGNKLGLGNKYALGAIPWNKGIKTGLVPKTAFKKGEHRKSESLWLLSVS